MLENIDCFIRADLYAASTIATYAHYLFLLSDWVIRCGIDPEQLAPNELMIFMDEHPDWSPQTRHSFLCAVKAFYKWFYKEHPICSLHVKRGKSGPQRSLTIQQVNAVLESFDTSTSVGVRNLAIIALLLETGIRANELVNLQLRNLSIDAGKFTVLAKGGRWQEKAFTDYTRGCLQNWLAARRLIAYPKVKTVFVGVCGKTPGRPMTTGGLRKLFRTFAQRAGLVDGFSPHDMRRTFATLMTLNGAPSRVVQVAGGWEDIRMIERYTSQISPADIEPYSPLNAFQLPKTYRR